jgi:hypothetical membrane protein
MSGIALLEAQGQSTLSRSVPAARVRDVSALPGFVLVLLGSSFLTVTMLAASIAPAYDFHGAAISDLGVIDETALIFNALLVAVGVLNIAGGYLLYRTHRRIWILGTYVLAGLGAAGAGFVPLDTSDFHSLFALFGFVFFNVEALASGTLVRGPMRAISYVAGLAGLAYVVVMIIGDAGNPAIFGAFGHGGSERMIVYPAMLWTLVFGGHLMAGGSVQRPELGPPQEA